MPGKLRFWESRRNFETLAGLSRLAPILAIIFNWNSVRPVLSFMNCSRSLAASHPCRFLKDIPSVRPLSAVTRERVDCIMSWRVIDMAKATALASLGSSRTSFMAFETICALSTSALRRAQIFGAMS